MDSGRSEEIQGENQGNCDQYKQYEALPGKFVNGDATQGENIADLGGVVMGFEAFKKRLSIKTRKK